MQNIWDTDEEEKKRRMMMGAPLEGIQYQRQDTQQAPVREQAGPPSVASTAKNMAVNRALSGGINQAIKAGEKGYDLAKNAYIGSQAPVTPDASYIAQDIQEGYSSAPLAETAVTNPLDYTAAAPAAPIDSAAATIAENTPVGDVTSGMVAAPLAEGATNAATDVVTSAATDAATDVATNMATNVGSEVATQAATEAASSAATEAASTAVAEGAAGSLAGPLAGGIELMKSGDVGKAGGKAAGAYAGAALGSMLGPAGTFVGGVLGSYIGGELGGYLT